MKTKWVRNYWMILLFLSVLTAFIMTSCTAEPGSSNRAPIKPPQDTQTVDNSTDAQTPETPADPAQNTAQGEAGTPVENAPATSNEAGAPGTAAGTQQTPPADTTPKAPPDELKIKPSGNEIDFTATTLDGKTVKLSDFRGKKAVLVDIWATWCGPCRMEMPELQKFYKSNSRDVEIIAASVDVKAQRKAVEKFVKENKITFTIVHDVDGAVSKNFQTKSIPFLVVFDKDGKQVKTFTGYRPGVIEEIKKLLKLN